MAIPITRQQFKENCLRRLGWPVIEINLSDEQIEDRIDEAMKYFVDHHYDATEKIYYKYQITADDVTNRYITLPENIIGAMSIFDIGFSNNSMNLFDVRYQLMMSELFNLSSVNLAPFYFSMMHLEFIDEILNGKMPIRYNRNRNRLFIDGDWNKLPVDTFLIVEAYQIIDPTEFPDVWGDKWLQRYCASLIKLNWGEVLSKFAGMPLIGGMQFNGQQIKLEAKQEISQLEYDLSNVYSAPPMGFMA